MATVDITGKRSQVKHWKKRKREPSSIILHCTDQNWTIDDLMAYDIAGYHPDLGRNHIDPTGLPGVSYHEVFMGDGTHYHCNNWDEIVWHAAGHNSRTLGAALMYRATNPDGKDFAPPSKAVAKFISWAATACLYLGLNPYRAVYGHRELKGTGWFFDRKGHKRLRKTCPGMAINLDSIRKSVAVGAQVVLYISAGTLGIQDIVGNDVKYWADGIWGKKTRLAARVAYERRNNLLAML